MNTIQQCVAGRYLAVKDSTLDACMYVCEQERQRQRAAESKQRLDRRQQLEASLPTLDAALEYLAANYNPSRLRTICGLIVKIVDKVVAHPDEPKYQRINLTKEAMQKVRYGPTRAPVGSQPYTRLRVAGGPRAGSRG